MGGWSPLRRIAATILPGRRSQNKASEDAVEEIAAVPPSQTVFLLHGPREEYRIVDDFPVPTLISIDEVLIKTKAIGLNPIDWKAP